MMFPLIESGRIEMLTLDLLLILMETLLLLAKES